MRGWPAVLIVALLTLTVPLVLVGCKGQAGKAATETASTEADEHEGHDHEADEKTESEAETGSEDEAAPILKGLESGEDAEVVAALEKVPMVKSQTAQQGLRSAVRGLAVAADSSPEVRTAALVAWAAWAATDPEPLLKAADSPHAPVRLAVALGLRSVSSPEATQVLERLKRDSDSTVKSAASETLAAILNAQGTEESINLLIADLGRQDGDRSAQAAMKLEQRGRVDRRVVAKLAQALRTSPDAAQRHSCASVLALVCAGTSPGQQRFAAGVNATFRGGTSTTPADEAGVAPLIEALRTDPDPMVREAAAFGLGLIGSPKAAKPLGRALSDPDVYVRRRAAAALVTVPAAEAKEDLVRAARKDPSPAVRRFAVQAMASLEGEDAGWSVAGCLRDPDADVRMYACEVLRKVGTRSQTEALLLLFEDPVDDVRWKAVEAVASFADPSAKAALIAALQDPSPRVALAAERGVHRLGIGTRVLTKDERFVPRR